ncbi:MAG: NAD-dependent epimerase/dehydratase family protein [Myxococcales bacterium]
MSERPRELAPDLQACFERKARQTDTVCAGREVSMQQDARILVTGITGFVGGHLRSHLASAGYEVVGATRDPERARRQLTDTELVRVDLLDAASVRRALEGCSAAFYLVHGMADYQDYAQVEARQAETFRMAARDAGVERIVYLGGPRPRGEPSLHLRSRLNTGEILRRGPVPTLELQASMIIGAGSESFRMVRDLAARLPLMVLPRWLETRTEPIAIRDVANALAYALSLPLPASQVLALPGPEVMSGRQILERTAQCMGLSPSMLGVPFLTPKLSSFWIQWVTRADSRVASQLVQGLTHDLVAPDQGLWELFPEYRRLSFDEAVRRALSEEQGPISLKAQLGESIAHRIGGLQARARHRAHP